ncbi:adaptor protein MecA [Enterococcus sp. HY326]|uniref:adaptor protein MecA n=1 Tax=Enterococcus sp. HY326 TaxID=2971265 RepID=UPI0022403BFE|nr:adaptor protein MecA [Enterococcus sp. HY326]
MEMEHINDNTIRVVIHNDDLVQRGITFLDLLGNHREIENFFYSILEEVDIEDEFRGSEAITFQVLPKGDGLELFISKNITPEDMEGLENNEEFRDDVAEYLKNQLTEDAENDLSLENLSSLVFEVADFEDLVQLAAEVYLDSAWTNLYRYKEGYYLQITFLQDDLNVMDKEDMISQVLEFANLSPITSEILAEHGQLLMERNALELLRYHFH